MADRGRSIFEGDRSILGGLSAEDRQRVLANTSRRLVARGNYVFHEGEVASSLFLINSGLVAIERSTPKGECATLTVYGPGEGFGELALVDEGAPRRTASAVAIEACSLQVLNKRDFNELRQSHPNVELVLIGILRSQVIRLTSQLVDTLTEDARTKVLRTLCRLAEVFKVAEGNRIRITHERLKTMAGVTRKVTDILNEIEIKGLIKRERGHAFYVPDLAALRAEAGLGPNR
jgi:CRP/FNR family transcriptional regulator, cyclic AMP receptor protein